MDAASPRLAEFVRSSYARVLFIFALILQCQHNRLCLDRTTALVPH